MIKRIKILLESIYSDNKYWKGKAYRSDSGYSHSSSDTAGDIIRYEQDELGNDYGISEEELKELDKYPARDTLWVTRTKAGAKRYGDPEPVYVEGWRIVCYDDEDGYLVLRER